MIENKQAWKDLLASIDDRQRAFNKQLEGVQPHELPRELVEAMKRYARLVHTSRKSVSQLNNGQRSLEKLAARVMEQAHIVPKGAPKDRRFVRVKEFTDQ